MNRDEIKTELLSEARRAAGNGPGWSQEGVVLREVGKKLAGRIGNRDVSREQAILDAWHDLFADRILAWGYDLDNPGSPFFHVRQPA